MNYSELVKAVSKEADTTEAIAKEVLEGLSKVLVSRLMKSEEITLAGLGKFKVKESPERSGRNPATGEAITIAASRKVSFASSKMLKDKMSA